MNFPKGAVWQSCREHALISITDASSFSPHNPLTLTNWRQRGSFSVVTASSKGFTLHCSAAEIGSAMLGDIEYLFNHIAEHRALVHDVIKGTQWNSPAWLLVTIYYWGLFAALIWTRLLGKGIIYLDRQSVRDLRTLASTTSGSPSGGGTYRIGIGEDLSATSREVMLEKLAASHFHECAWQQIIRDAKCRFDQYADEDTDKTEFRMFRCLAFPGHATTDAWPSELRNAVNYRPGFAYTQVIKAPGLDLIQFIRNHPFRSVEDVVDTYELELNKITSVSSIATTPSSYSKVMFLKATILTSLCEELFAEVLQIRRLDPRWSNKRASFYKERGIQREGKVWPIENKEC